MANDNTGNLPDMYVSAAMTVRTAVKWGAGAFAAVAALLLGTSPLTNLGVLSFGSARLWLALASGLVAIIATIVLIFGAIYVLTPVDVDLHSIPRKICADIESHSSALRSTPYHSVTELEAAWTNAHKLAYGPDPVEPRVESSRQIAEAAEADANLVTLDSVVTEVTADAAWHLLDNRSRRYRHMAVAAAIVVGAAIITYSWAANPAKNPGTTGSAAASEALPQQPVQVQLRLGPVDRAVLMPILGKRCVSAPVSALAIDLQQSSFDLVAMPNNSCPLVRFRLAPHGETMITTTHTVPIK